MFRKSNIVISTLATEWEKGPIDMAFIYGSFACSTELSDSDIDVFIIGSISESSIAQMLSELEKTSGRQINSYIISRSELQQKLQTHFIETVLDGPKIFIKGSNEQLQSLIKQK